MKEIEVCLSRRYSERLMIVEEDFMLFRKMLKYNIERSSICHICVRLKQLIKMPESPVYIWASGILYYRKNPDIPLTCWGTGKTYALMPLTVGEVVHFGVHFF